VPRQQFPQPLVVGFDCKLCQFVGGVATQRGRVVTGTRLDMQGVRHTRSDAPAAARVPSAGPTLPDVKTPLPPVAVAIRFIDCVNRGDLDGLVATMTDDHRLEIFDEEPLLGKDANAAAWRGYFEGFPNYVIYPHHIVEVTGSLVAILGHTTGSHLGLPDAEESQETLIWLAETRSGQVRVWSLIDDTPDNRRRLSLT
jgi:SnoaL-like domain